MECLMKGNEMGVKDKIKRVMPQRIWNEIKSCTDKYYEGKMRKKCKLIEEFRPSESEFGVNLIGDIRAETGLGQSMRIIADHIRTSVFISADDSGITPSNTDQGYILRRLIRRAIRHAKKLNIALPFFHFVANAPHHLYIFWLFWIQLQLFTNTPDMNHDSFF